jgi:hypothetical protein
MVSMTHATIERPHHDLGRPDSETTGQFAAQPPSAEVTGGFARIALDHVAALPMPPDTYSFLNRADKALIFNTKIPVGDKYASQRELVQRIDQSRGVYGGLTDEQQTTVDKIIADQTLDLADELYYQARKPAAEEDGSYLPLLSDLKLIGTGRDIAAQVDSGDGTLDQIDMRLFELMDDLMRAYHQEFKSGKNRNELPENKNMTLEVKSMQQGLEHARATKESFMKLYTALLQEGLAKKTQNNSQGDLAYSTFGIQEPSPQHSVSEQIDRASDFSTKMELFEKNFDLPPSARLSQLERIAQQTEATLTPEEHEYLQQNLIQATQELATAALHKHARGKHIKNQWWRRVKPDLGTPFTLERAVGMLDEDSPERKQLIAETQAVIDRFERGTEYTHKYDEDHEPITRTLSEKLEKERSNRVRSSLSTSARNLKTFIKGGRSRQ